ncbi:uncharacterized protein LOC108869899 [Brassica rapa]|uniref:uncharacterized protein LOC108869899 n=1 Tax=Brassica campestris TaxID=3711 RepID=UPI00142D8ABF|nr:uncharacterized protein LOC108869899 [Brassica rapa]
MDLCTDSPDASIPIQGPSFMPRRLQFVNSRLLKLTSCTAMKSQSPELKFRHKNMWMVNQHGLNRASNCWMRMIVHCLWSRFLLWWNQLEPVATVSCFGASRLKPELSKFSPGDIKEDTVARLPQSSRVVNKEAKRLSG